MLYYDKQHLLEILQAFYILSKIRVALVYSNTQEFVGYPDEKNLFCNIVRSNPDINKKCIECDLFHMEKCRKIKTTLVYTCHLGLTEVITPIINNDVIICYITFGQFLMEEFKEQSQLLIYNNIREAGFDDDIIKKAINKIRSVSSAKLKASTKILEAIISQIFSTKLIEITRIDFLKHLNSFIDTHISENILVQDISNHFQISRASLYEYSKKYLDCGLSEYVLNRKIDYVKKKLGDSKIKINELSQKIGFTDYNYFSRVFRKKTGSSPRIYRQNLHKNTGMNQ